MKCYAVVDTNVIVSALITKNPDSPPRQVFRAMLTGDIVPLYHPDILAEYEEVLCRKKFHLQVETVRTVVDAIRQFGIEVQPKPTGEILIDMDDLVFYEVAMRSGTTVLISSQAIRSTTPSGISSSPPPKWWRF